MRITEIYASIHGESQYAGLPCTLVRTTGCDLRCTYCDTTYAFTGGRDMTVDEIVAEVERLAMPFVLLTGGEPMLQPEIARLAERLLAGGYRVAIETSGAHPLDGLPARGPAHRRRQDARRPGKVAACAGTCWPSSAPATPSSSCLSDEADYRWSAEHVQRLGLATGAEVLFSPVHGQLDPRALVAWLVRDRLPVRVSLQLHKYIWGPDTRGV